MPVRKKGDRSFSEQNNKSRHKHQEQTMGKSKRLKSKDTHQPKNEARQSMEKTNIGYIAVVFVFAAVFGVLHRHHIAGMFESDRHFSHLSTLERDLAFRTEMGLYYSYYKTIIEAPSFTEGMQLIMYDNVTEFPATINTLKRFNLYPEMALGAAYRLFEATASRYNIKTRMCWRTNRGKDMPPIVSCEGLGDPHYFYIEMVFLLNGINMAVFFLFATYLSGSIVGGILAVSAFFFNHGECTRVQWTPPLRESFAYPFFVIEMLIVTIVIKSSRPGWRHSLAIALAAVCFMLPWQFAQFALLTQCLAVFATYVLGFIGVHKMRVVLAGQAMGLVVSYLCMFGNEMMLTSFYSGAILTAYIITGCESVIERLKFRPAIWVVQGGLMLAGTVLVKLVTSRLLGVSDDAHIGEILASKFSDYKNFHTMLYTCAAEFDFIELETIFKLLKSCLLPSAYIALVAAVMKIVYQEYLAYTSDSGDATSDHVNGDVTDRTTENNNNSLRSKTEVKYRFKENAEVVYHVLQVLAFTVMAVLIMRLKLFWTPHLCLLASLLASKQFFGWLPSRTVHYGLVFAVLGLMSIAGTANLAHQWRIQGEFSNYPQEQLVNWINDNTPTTAVFGGPMPTMATVKLCTNRPIVNHPHYEDANLRARTKKVYSMYSRKPAEEVWRNLRDLRVDYAILEMSWCQRRSRPGCGMAEIWDIEDVENRHRETPTCFELAKDPSPYFKRAFKNKVYDVLEVVKHPVLS